MAVFPSAETATEKPLFGASDDAGPNQLRPLLRELATASSNEKISVAMLSTDAANVGQIRAGTELTHMRHLECSRVAP
jgi:hypothetical protein